MGFVGRVTNTNFLWTIVILSHKNIQKTESSGHFYLHVAPRKVRKHLMFWIMQTDDRWKVQRLFVFLSRQTLHSTSQQRDMIPEPAKGENGKHNPKSFLFQEQTGATTELLKLRIPSKQQRWLSPSQWEAVQLAQGEGSWVQYWL